MKQAVKTTLWIVALMLYTAIHVPAQQASVTVKPSPAVDALNRAAQDLATEQKSFDVILQQARSTMDANQKSVQVEIQKANSELLTELKADKKYKDKLENIESLQKKLQALGQDAQQKLNQEANPIQNEIAKDRALIEGLTPVVREENDLPATATFDSATQKWTVPKK